ncbi:MAG: PaaI family thioesterase [Oscillospiraceae bacterium]|nr:PaaI family thioesterase [Oscillospiraceae bacterium]
MEHSGVEKVIAHEGFDAHNGIHVVRCGEGMSEVRVALTDKSLNVWRIPHGGLLYSIADVAAGAAATGGRDNGVVTVSGTLNFLHAAKGAKSLIARAQEEKRGRTTSFYSIRITDEDETLIATASFVMHNTTAYGERAR